MSVARSSDARRSVHRVQYIYRQLLHSSRSVTRPAAAHVRAQWRRRLRDHNIVDVIFVSSFAHLSLCFVCVLYDAVS